MIAPVAHAVLMELVNDGVVVVIEPVTRAAANQHACKEYGEEAQEEYECCRHETPRYDWSGGPQLPRSDPAYLPLLRLSYYTSDK